MILLSKRTGRRVIQFQSCRKYNNELTPPFENPMSEDIAYSQIYTSTKEGKKSKKHHVRSSILEDEVLLQA